MTKLRMIVLGLALACVFFSHMPLSLGVEAEPKTVPQAPTPPTLRLPRTFLPTAYAARLVIAPDSATFTGHIDIDAQLTGDASVIWLNAQSLTIADATLSGADGAPEILEILPAEKSFVAFRAASAIPAGPVRLSINYSGLVDAKDSAGIFHQKEGGDWYAFTQFEAVFARRAFPCFDEPDVKVPWQLTLEVPADSVAVSNTPIAAEVQGTDGTKVFTFARTKPLPSYLIAFAVGPFDFVNAGTSRSGVPLRVVTPRGLGAQTTWAIQSTLPLLSLLEDYFGTPYPYEKLDLVSIPHTVTFGAMENPGMITFEQGDLLRKDDESTIGFRRSYAAEAAHEMSHQWFGDLVTMSWWNDVWLNEAFARWMEEKIVDAWKPEWDDGVGLVNLKSGAMGSDSLKTARRIHQQIETENDIKNAFDGITYNKGAAVIRAFELWVGPATFQKGIRKYLGDHAWKNATSTDFLTAIGEAAEKDVTTPFSTFLDQVGAPIVSVALSCNQGAAPTLTLAQKRYLPFGSTADLEQVWQIPVCVKYAAGKIEANECTLMTAATAEFPLAQAKTCPKWVLANSGELGYYRTRLEGDLLHRLLKQGMPRLTLPERVGVIGDVGALVASGQIPAGDALALVAMLANDGNRHIVGASARIAAGPDDIIGDALRPNYTRFVGKMFGAKAQTLGWTTKVGDDEDTQILRNSVVGLVADKGEDETLVGEATKLAWLWLDDHKAVDPNMVGLVLGIAAKNGDRKLYDRLYAEAKKATDLSERQRLLGAMGGFTDPAIAKVALALTLTDEFDTREVMGAMVFGALGNRSTRRLAYEFVKSNFDAIIAKVPKEAAASLVFVGVRQCDAKLRDDVAGFFKDRNAALPGGPLMFSQGLERMDLCIALRERQRPSIEEFLKKY